MNREVAGMADDVGYVEFGPEGKTCADCAHYEPSSEAPGAGKCMGFDVRAAATCNFFEKADNG
jgi:hypothetical protein